MSPAGLPLELQVGFLNPGQGKVLNRTRRGLESDDSLFEAGENAIPVAPPGHRVAQADFGLLAPKPLIVLWFEKLTFHPGGAHFERILAAWDDVFDIQNGAHLLGNQLAIAMRDAVGLVDGDADEAVHSAALYFHLHQFQAFRLSHAVREDRKSTRLN